MAATSAGVYYLNADDLSYQHFFDTEGALTALAVSEDEEWVVTGDNKGTVLPLALRTLLDFPDFRRDLAVRARQRTVNEYSLETNIDRVVDLYHDLVGK